MSPSTSSVNLNSDFSLSDSVSALEMTDDETIPAPDKEVFTLRPFEKEGSLNSSMITVIVDDIHFRLDSHFLQRESEILKNIITASEEAGSICLQKVTAAEFRALWRFFYEGMYDDYKPSIAEWMDLLSIANTYGLERVYRRAVAEIEDIDITDDPVKRLLLAKQLKIKKWLAPAYVALCTRTDPIKASEAEKLGIYTFVTLVAAREAIYRDSSSQSTIMKDRASSVTVNLRCCGYTPSQLHDGANGAKMCPSCQQIVIPGPGLQPAVTNNNRRCCTYYDPSQWCVGTDGSLTCPNCGGVVLPALVTANLTCCGYKPPNFTDDTNGAKKCPGCQQIVIPAHGEADFTNNNRRCCNNAPSSWISQLDGSQICPSCKGVVLPVCHLSVHERALAHVKRVFDLEG